MNKHCHSEPRAVGQGWMNVLCLLPTRMQFIRIVTCLLTTLKLLVLQQGTYSIHKTQGNCFWLQTVSYAVACEMLP